MKQQIYIYIHGNTPDAEVNYKEYIDQKRRISQDVGIEKKHYYSINFVLSCVFHR